MSDTSVFPFKVGDRVEDLSLNGGVGTVTEVDTDRLFPLTIKFDNTKGHKTRCFNEVRFVASQEEPMPNAVNMQQRALVYSEASSGGGMKYDGDKARMDLMLDGMPNALEQVAQILTFGAKKYADHSWQTVPSGKARYKAALLRHLTAHAKGEINDPESGMPHLAHAACNALFILELEQRDAAD